MFSTDHDKKNGQSQKSPTLKSNEQKQQTAVVAIALDNTESPAHEYRQVGRQAGAQMGPI